jgi:hypothetical protein
MFPHPQRLCRNGPNRKTDSKALECGASLKSIGKCLWCLKSYLFMVLKLLNLIAQRFRSKAFSSAYLFRSSIMTQSSGGEGLIADSFDSLIVNCK